jgi:hypothetical protein
MLSIGYRYYVIHSSFLIASFNVTLNTVRYHQHIAVHLSISSYYIGTYWYGTNGINQPVTTPKMHCWNQKIVPTK